MKISEIIDLIDNKKEIYFKQMLKTQGKENHQINYAGFLALTYLKKDILNKIEKEKLDQLDPAPLTNE